MQGWPQTTYGDKEKYMRTQLNGGNTNPLTLLIEAASAYEICSRTRGVKVESNLCVCCLKADTCPSEYRASGGRPGKCKFELDQRDPNDTLRRVMAFLQDW
jgi:hypothetical protein